VLCEAGHVTALLPRVALSPGPGTGSGAASGGAASGGAPASGAGGGGAGTAGACGNAPLADVDTNFVDIVLRIARAARPLHALAPPQTLLPVLERSAEHSPQLKALLAELAKDGNPLVAPEDSSAAAGRARAATKRLRWGRKGAALRTLLSAGVANEHPCAERIMRDMHPAPSRPVTAPQDLGPGLEATAEGVQRALDELLKCDFTSMDFSGWSMDLLRPVRGRIDIMQPLHALDLAIANYEVPLSVF
jgi:hypothetical protein